MHGRLVFKEKPDSKDGFVASGRHSVEPLCAPHCSEFLCLCTFNDLSLLDSLESVFTRFQSLQFNFLDGGQSTCVTSWNASVLSTSRGCQLYGNESQQKEVGEESFHSVKKSLDEAQKIRGRVETKKLVDPAGLEPATF